jgi:hypothetical protein
MVSHVLNRGVVRIQLFEKLAALRAGLVLRAPGMAVVEFLVTLLWHNPGAIGADGVADRCASELERAGQSSRRRGGIGLATRES